jgi:hypothetical protein
MNLLEKFKTASTLFQTGTEAIGKTIWIVIMGFVGLAIASGHPALLQTLKARLIQAGFTSVKTPVGDMDPNKIGLASEVLGINAARAKSIAETVQDAAAKAQLNAMAEDLSRQQQQKVEELARMTASQRPQNRALTATNAASVQRWIYLGRYSGGQWMPASFSVAAPAYPLTPRQLLTVTSDALLYAGIDCQRADLSGQAGTGDSKAQASFVRAGPEGIPLTGKTQECDSVGGAKTVWAELDIPAARFHDFQ